jgi:peroxiredoxin
VNKQTLIRTAGFLLLVFLAAFGGVWAGMKFRQAQAPPAGAPAVPESRLVAGVDFPDERLVVPEDGRELATGDLVADGAVVLFLRSDCPACGEMTKRWKELAAAGDLDGVPAFGVSIEPPETITAYRQEKELPFPVYQDAERRFIEHWEVNAVPLVVVVGPGGEVQQSFYFTSLLKADEIRRQVGLG